MAAFRISGRVRATVLTVLVVVGTAVIAVLAHVWGSGQRVSTIRVEGATLVPEGTLVERSGVTTGDLLYEVDLYKVRERLCGHPYVADAAVRREAPDRIVLSVVERKPVAAVSSVPVVLVDADGVILPMPVTGRVLDLPVLSGTFRPGDLRPGRRLDDPLFQQGLRLAMTLLSLDRVNSRISEIHLTPSDGVVLLTAEWGVPVLAGAERYREKLMSFGAFWDQVVMRGDVQQLRSVDLRYEGQVIARWKPGGREG